MILVQCTQSVMKQTHQEFVEYIHSTLLFREGYIYIAREGEDGQYLAEDEEGAPHVIADGDPNVINDPWFNNHFNLL